MPNTYEAPKIVKPASLQYAYLPVTFGAQTSGGAGCESPAVGLTFPRGVRQSPAIVVDSGGGAVQPAQSWRNFILSLDPRLFMRMSTLTTDATPKLKDESDWNNHGTIDGSPSIGGVAGLVTNDSDAATDFDGSNDRVNIGLGSGLQLQQLSVFAIVKPVSGQVMEIMSYLSSDSATVARGFLLRVSSGLVPSWTAGGNALGAYQGINAAAALTAGVRTFIVGTYDGVLQRIYINGQLSASGGNGTGLISYTNASGLYVGYTFVGSALYSRGVHDEVGVIPSVLTGAQVLEMYNKLAGLG